jgi:DNA helicase TIP49 (TBP-interacting protein)
MRVIIDRFEGDYAVCEKENKEIIEIRKEKIPEDAREGDILIIESETIKIDRIGTAKRKKMIESIMKDLWKS